MKKCKVCKVPFEPYNSLAVACSASCALIHGKAETAKKAAKVKKESRQWVRAQKEKLKTIGQWTKEAEKEFNAFIRIRDQAEPCICCGQWGDDEFWKLGGQWDAGHYLSKGSHPEHRFDEANVHRQLKSCNAGEGKYAKKRRTVSEGYRERLILKIGQAEVDRLEGPSEPKLYRADDLKEIKAKYHALTRELQRQREAA